MGVKGDAMLESSAPRERTMTDIGFIGLGNMGGPMARNLVKAGHKVRGFDLAPAAIAAAKENGIATVDNAAEAALGAEVVISMLPSRSL